MASYLDSMSERDIATLAAIAETDPVELTKDLRRRPWVIHDLLSRDDVFDAVMDRHAHPANLVSPFFLFAVLVHRAAAELREATFVSDWAGPRSRLPVFDVAPLQEFVEDGARTSFLARLLTSFAMPEPVPVPADRFDLTSMALWLDQAMPADRTVLLRRLGDLALFMAGVFPDRTGSRPLLPVDAERLGRTVHMTADEVLSLCDPVRLAPGLTALETLGSRWYSASVDGGEPPLVADVGRRFSAARRVLNHLADRHLYKIDPGWIVAA